jgi:endonuclease I
MKRHAHLLWLLLAWAGCSDPAQQPATGAPPAVEPGPSGSADPDAGGMADVTTSDASRAADARADARARMDAAAAYAALEGLTDGALRQGLYDLVKDHRSLGYDAARDAMFGITSQFDVHGGSLECIYTGRLVAPNGTRVPGGFNTEHTWPQSLGASQEPARSDLHHLFPVDDNINNARASFPFGETDCTTSCAYQAGGSKLGIRSGGAETVFQVRPERRGDVARAQFYFSVRYQLNIPGTVEQTLRAWSAADPVDTLERDRNDAIEQLQENRNPFVDRPDFIAKISDF